MKQTDKLFNQPKAAWTDLYVVPMDMVSGAESEKTDSGLEDFNKGILYLHKGFDNLVAEYDKILKVLIKRADIRKIKLNTLQLAEVDQAFSNALRLLYGHIPESLPFIKYVELLKYEQSIASAHTANMVDPALLGNTNIIESSQVLSSPEMQAIQIMKAAFKQQLIKDGAEDLLLADMAVLNQSMNSSNKSLIEEVAKKTDGSSILSADEPYESSRVEIDGLLEDCLPCLERSLYLVTDFPRHLIWNKFRDSIWQSFLSQLQELAAFKLAISGYSYLNRICGIIDSFIHAACLPDLVSILAILKMMIARAKGLFIDKFKLGASSLLADLSVLITSPILDAVLALLIRALNSVLSPFDCVLSSLKHEMHKVFIESSDYDKQSRDFITGIINDMHEYRRWLDAMILNFINEKTRDWELKIYEEEDALDLYDNLQKYSQITALVMEIIDLGSRTVELIGDEKANAYKTICERAFTTQPWMSVIAISMPVDDPEISGTNNDAVNDAVNEGVNDAVSNIIDNLGTILNESDPGSGSTSDTKEVLLIIDSSLPPDFFTDADIDDILEDPYIQAILKELNYEDDVEHGKHPLAIDNDFIKKFSAVKNSIKSTVSTAIKNNVNNNQLTGDTLPTYVIDYSDCLKANNMVGYSDEQIKQWINRITG